MSYKKFRWMAGDSDGVRVGFPGYQEQADNPPTVAELNAQMREDLNLSGVLGRLPPGDRAPAATHFVVRPPAAETPEHTGDKPPEQCTCGSTDLFLGAGQAKCLSCKKLFQWRRR